MLDLTALFDIIPSETFLKNIPCPLFVFNIISGVGFTERSNKIFVNNNRRSDINRNVRPIQRCDTVYIILKGHNFKHITVAPFFFVAIIDIISKFRKAYKHTSCSCNIRPYIRNTHYNIGNEGTGNSRRKIFARTSGVINHFKIAVKV